MVHNMILPNLAHVILGTTLAHRLSSPLVFLTISYAIVWELNKSMLTQCGISIPSPMVIEGAMI